MPAFDAMFIPGRDSLETFDRRLEAFCRSLKPAEAGMDLFIATHELLINSIAEMENNPGVCTKAIHVTVHEAPAYLEAVVVDRGRGIDRDKRPGDDPNDLLLEEGRGLMMVELLTDYFATRTEDDGCKAYVIRKHI